MEARIAARPTFYSGVQFRSRLEARWAAMFDLMDWKWQYEPIDFTDWVPDFRLQFDCRHSECRLHNVYVEIKPYSTIEEFRNHPAFRDSYGHRYGLEGSLLLGLDPSVAYIEFCHGSGGGVYQGIDFFNVFHFPYHSSPNYGKSYEDCWIEAGNLTQWRGSGGEKSQSR